MVSVLAVQSPENILFELLTKSPYINFTEHAAINWKFFALLARKSVSGKSDSQKQFDNQKILFVKWKFEFVFMEFFTITNCNLNVTASQMQNFNFTLLNGKGNRQNLIFRPKGMISSLKTQFFKMRPI